MYVDFSFILNYLPDIQLVRATLALTMSKIQGAWRLQTGGN